MKKSLFNISLFVIISIIVCCNYSVKSASNINWHVGNNYVYNNTTAPLLSISNNDIDLKYTFNFATSGGLQGFCLANNYVLSAYMKNDDSENPTTELEIFNNTTNPFIKTKSIYPLNLGHANDCTYNSKKGTIIFTSISNNVEEIELNKLTSEQTITDNDFHTNIISSTNGVSSIAYDNDNDQYIVYRSKTIYITDLDFNVKSHFDVTNNLVPQGISYWKNHIYYVCSEFGMDNISNQPTAYNSTEKGSSLVFIYDMNGNLIKVIYIPKSTIMPGNTSSDDFPELESVSFYDDGEMLLGFNVYHSYLKQGYNKDRTFYTTDKVKLDTELTPVPRTISSINVSTLPTKTTYIQNYEDLNLSGGKLEVKYSDDTYEYVDLDDNEVNITGFSNSTTGTKTLTVTYGGKKTTFNVSVVSKSISSIQMKTNPKKTSYIQNYETLDLTGGVIRISYNDTSIDEMSLTNENIQVIGFSNSTVGTKTLTVRYGGKTCTFSVDIVKKQISKIEMKTPPIKNKYIQNYETLDLTGGSIKITYNDTSIDEMSLTNENIQVIGFSNSTVGTKTLTVRYSGKTCTFNVEIVSKQVSEIEILEFPLKSYYLKNSEDLDLTGGILKIIYDDKSTDEISLTNEEITVSGFSNKNLGKKTILVTYKDKQISFDVEIIEVETNDEAKVVNVPDTSLFINFVGFGTICIIIGAATLIIMKIRIKNNTI